MEQPSVACITRYFGELKDPRTGNAKAHIFLQTKVADKSNEITAIPELLQLLDITDCIVTIDAIGTQTEIVETIVAGAGGYLLAVKDHQGHLFEDIHCQFEIDVAHGIEKAQHSYAQTVTKGHEEKRF